MRPASTLSIVYALTYHPRTSSHYITSPLVVLTIILASSSLIVLTIVPSAHDIPSPLVVLTIIPSSSPLIVITIAPSSSTTVSPLTRPITFCPILYPPHITSTIVIPVPPERNISSPCDTTSVVSNQDDRAR